MSMQEVLNSLSGFDTKKNESLEMIASTALELTKMYEEEQSITASEYQELLKDLQLEKSITVDASDLDAKAQLKFIIDTAITVAAAAAKAI